MTKKIYLVGGTGYIGRNLMKENNICFINIRSWQNIRLPTSSNLIYLAGNSNTNLNFEESKEELIKERKNLNFYLKQDINVFYLSSFRTLCAFN